MDLASGYSDNTNYGNGYTPLANNAIANNNASYAQQQAVMALMAQQARTSLTPTSRRRGPPAVTAQSADTRPLATPQPPAPTVPAAA